MGRSRNADQMAGVWDIRVPGPLFSEAEGEDSEALGSESPVTVLARLQSPKVPEARGKSSCDFLK